MNKYQEALKDLNESMKSFHQRTNSEVTNKESKNWEILQELVDKATPKPPTKDYSLHERYPWIKFVCYCPNCGEELATAMDSPISLGKESNTTDEYDYDYCSCGQCIDWSEDE